MNVVQSLRIKGLLTEERPPNCARTYPCRYINAEQCARDTALGAECPKICDCRCHKDFPDCDHESIGHNDGECCAVCALSMEIDGLQARLAELRPGNEEIDEAVVRLLEYNGCRGWETRELIVHARGMDRIIRALLAGELRAEPEQQ